MYLTVGTRACVCACVCACVRVVCMCVGGGVGAERVRAQEAVEPCLSRDFVPLKPLFVLH